MNTQENPILDTFWGLFSILGQTRIFPENPFLSLFSGDTRTD